MKTLAAIKYLSFIVLVLCSLMGRGGEAQAAIAPSLETNGCGAKKGWSSKLVPNGTFLSKCQFKPSCDKHDICYSRCLKGGDLYGKPECLDARGSLAKESRRQICDVALQADILTGNTDKPACSFYAGFYSWAVQTFGEGNFSGIGEGALSVIREFLLYGQKNPGKYTPKDMDALNAAITNRASMPNEMYSAEFDRFTGRFKLWSSLNGEKKLVVQIPSGGDMK